MTMLSFKFFQKVTVLPSTGKFNDSFQRVAKKLRFLSSAEFKRSAEGWIRMLKIDKEALDHMEKEYPGIGEAILRFEKTTLPVCSRCVSENTAAVQCGIIGRTINIAAATTKFKLIANGPKPGAYFCNTCNEFFN